MISLTVAKCMEVCEQAVFTYVHSGMNLDKDDIVFTVKKMVNNYKRDYPLIFEENSYSRGRPKEYELDELLGFVVYGALEGKYSCRKLADWINNNDESVNYILNDKKPKKSKIAEFIQNNGLLIDLFFKYTVQCGVKLGLIDGVDTYTDGSIVKANACRFKLIRIEEVKFLRELILTYCEDSGKNGVWFKLHKYFHENKKYTSITRLIDEIKDNLRANPLKLLKTALISPEKREFILDYLDILEENYDGKHTMSLTDPEARWMKDKKEVMGLNFNYQAILDGKHEMIIGHYLTKSPTDHHELYNAWQQAKMNLEKNPDILVADNGYLNDDILEKAYQENVLVIIPDRNEASKTKPENMKKQYSKVNFQYDFKNDTYTCPQGSVLFYKNDRKLNNVWNKVYSTNDCKTCSEHDKCTKSRIREIFEPCNPLRWKLKEDYHSDMGQKYYKKRGYINEGYFGILKNARKFQTLERRGIKNAQKELTIRAIAHNIQKIHEKAKVTLI